MRLKRFNLMPLVVLAWTLVFYFLATGVHDWRLWLVTLFVFFDMLIIRIGLIIMARASVMLARKLQANLGNIPNN